MNALGRFYLRIWKTRPAQMLLRYLRPMLGARPDWSWLATDPAWRSARREARNGKKILIATGTGSNWPCSSLEGLLGIALTLRGANVKFLLCDGVLPACQECDLQWLSGDDLINRGPQPSVCATCFSPAYAMLTPLQLPILRYSEYLREGADEGTASKGLTGALSEHALAGALRYFARGSLPDGGGGARILFRYQQAAKITARVIAHLVAEQRPDVAVFHHGIYVPQGVVGAVMREAGVRVVNWGPAYRKSTVLFSHGDSYHHTMVDESSACWSEMSWVAADEARVMNYLGSRWTGGNDWVNFQVGAEIDSREIVARLKLDGSRPIIGLLTNVLWDAQLHFRKTAYPSMLDWLFASISYFLERKDLQLVIRIHPAELLGTVPSRQYVAEEIDRRFGALPDHIKVVGPDEKISTYALMSLCNSALVYGTKTALELACNGLPVVVAGEAWCRGKGFTIDVSTPEEYQQALEQLPFTQKLSPEQVIAARKYAYHFFFRRMIPLKSLKPMNRFGPYSVKVNSLGELMHGRDAGLDVICDGIMNGREFIF